MTINEKKQILNSVLETVEGISDIEYQKRVWIRGEGPECDDFTETTCHFFEEGDGILEKYKEFGISEKQYNSILILREKFNNFIKGPKLGYLPEEFINTPEWEQIINLAKDVLRAFDYQKK